MSTWRIFSDTGNNFRWEISDHHLHEQQQCQTVSQQETEDPPRLPSMSDLLFIGCSDILENGSGNSENPPLFRTGLGKSVTVKQSSVEKARSVLGDVDDVPTNTGNSDEGGNGFTSLKPLFEMGSLKSAAMPWSGGHNTSKRAAHISNSMFQTGSGKAVNISSAGLHRAKALLGIDEDSDRESLHAYEQSQMPPATAKLLARENPSHLENEDVSNLNLSTTESLACFGVNLCRSESKRFSDSVNDAKPSPIKFHTAGGRSISVSSDALQRARRLLGNIDIDSVANEESTADPVFSLVADQKHNCSDQNQDFSSPFLQKRVENGLSSSRNFTSPLTSYSYQKHQKPLLGKFRKIVPGNNLVTKFDAEATTNTAKGPYSGHTCEKKQQKENSFSTKLDFLGKTAQPQNHPLNRPANGALLDISNTMSASSSTHNKQYGEKRKPTLMLSVSSFKKPRSSFITPFNKINSSTTNDLSRLAPKESWSKQRASTRYPLQVPRKYLREVVLQPPFQEKLDKLPEYVKRMNPVAAESYTFQNEMSSGCYGVEAFYRMLSDSGASTQYMTKEWVSNHYKWIVWKLASYERCYPTKFSGKLLLVSNVLEELKYRYEREVNHGHRSAIKKILDGDSPASSTMVLCISSIGGKSDPKVGHQVASSEANGHALKIQLTDGWYSVNALLDELLSQKLVSGKLFLGQKLKISGAKLCGWLGPISPLEALDTSLLLHMNGTYRCHWAEKLGFCKNACIPLAFRCIKSTGGTVPSTLIGLTRRYPILYRERLSDGSFVVRSKRMEAKAVQLYNQRRDIIAEEIMSTFQRESDFDVGNDHGNEEGAKIMKLLETAAEPEVLMAGMSSKQLTYFTSYKAKLEAMGQSDMQNSIEKAIEAAGLNKRDVTPFMRVKVIGLTDKFHPKEGGQQQGLITIWNPTQKEMLELCEGQGYAVGNLLPSSSDSSLLYLQARGSSSNWLPLSPLTMEKYRDSFRQFFTPRSATKISSLGKVPISSEFDIAAFIVYVGEVYRQGHQQKQWVFVTDGSTSTESCENRWQEQEQNEDALLAIKLCLPGHAAAAEVHSCGLVNSNIAGSVVGFCNLTKRPRDRANGLWVAEATENSDYFLSYDDSSCKHLKETAACVINWARTSNLIVQHLEKKVLSILQNTKDGY